MADQQYEYPTSPSPYLSDPSPGFVFHHPPDTGSELGPGSSGGRIPHLEETEHSQDLVHATNTAELYSSTERNQFTLLGSHHNPGSLGQLIYEHAATSSRIGIEKREIASKFNHELKSFAAHLKQCKSRYQLSGNIPENRATLKAYSKEGEILHTRVQDLLSMIEEIIQPFPLHEDGNPGQEAWETFTKIFLNDDHQSQAVQDLTRDMDSWVEYYKLECVFKPFVFLGRDFDAFDFERNLTACADCIYSPESRTARPLRDFCDELTELTEKLDNIRNHEPLCERRGFSHRLPEARAVIDDFISEGETLNAKVRDLVTVCEAGVPTPYRCGDGSITHDVCLSFTKALLRQNRERLKELTWAMREWLESYDKNCAPVLKRMREEAERRQPRQ